MTRSMFSRPPETAAICAFAMCLLLPGCGSAPVESAITYRRISVAEYQEKVYASWLGQMVGNIYGLPHENQHIDKPGAENFPYGYRIANPDPADFEHGYSSRMDQVERVNGAFSDDDTDIEYLYLLQMEKYGPEPSYSQLTEAWKHHIRGRVWLANRAALGAMHFGYEPPFTGRQDYNPHWFQIDPQLVNEIWAVTAPGMVDYAVGKSAWAARITNDGWGIEPTMFYGAMYSAAFFESDVRELIEIGIESLPEDSRFVETVQDLKALYARYPDDWQAAWEEMARKYYIDEPEDTKTIWNANLNAAAGILALLYGDNDFQRTLDLSCAMGFDADNQAATMAGLMGAALGLDGIPRQLLYPVEEWTEPFNDFYKNESRHDVPDANIKDMARRMAAQAEKIILAHGGDKVEENGEEYYVINSTALFTPPLELPAAPLPLLEVGQAVDHTFLALGGNQSLRWTIASGNLPEGLAFGDGRLTGTPEQGGVYPVVIQIEQGDRKASRELKLVVRTPNLAPDAVGVLASVERTNTAVRDSMWLTVGRSLYANDVSVIRDGVTVGEGSTFYSIIESPDPRSDYYGYEWSEPQEIGLIGFHTGAMEENGGWFNTLQVEYRGSNGTWQPVRSLSTTPSLMSGGEPYNKPHFVEYLLAFEPVTTTAIRIIGEAGGSEHWYSDRTHFTSITELRVHGPLPEYTRLASR